MPTHDQLMRSDWFHREAWQSRQRAHSRHSREGHTDCPRITLNGQTIDHCRMMACNAPHAWRAECQFWNHLKHAFIGPEGFTFVGFGGRQDAAGWLAYHADRLGVTWDGTLALWKAGADEPTDVMLICSAEVVG